MKPERKLFELTPLSEKPEVYGAYFCKTKDEHKIYHYWYDMDGWSVSGDEPVPEYWLKPVSNINSGGHSFVQYHPDIIFPDGVYNGKYNKEPALIRIHGGRPTYVTFMGFMKEGESRSSSIFDERGIMASNVELLLKSQTISEGCYITL